MAYSSLNVNGIEIYQLDVNALCQSIQILRQQRVPMQLTNI